MPEYGVREYGVREKVRFDSGGTECVAWHYPGTNGGCVIMAGGFAVTKEPGTDLFAKRFWDRGFSVLAFDYRHLGESGGQPRQVVRVREQLGDWSAAIGFAAGLPGRAASRVRCPLLVLVCDQDRSALAEPAVRAARRAPRAELVRLPGGHYAPFLEGHELAVAAELSFLRRHLLDADRPRAAVDSGRGRA